MFFEENGFPITTSGMTQKADAEQRGISLIKVPLLS
jgi:hypothetical protein